MSEQAASNWFNGTETVETSIAQLVSEIKEYVDTQPRDFRLLFMIDEVGQYVGGDTDLLINWLYNLSIDNNYYAIGAAISLIIFIITSAISLAAYVFSPAYRQEGTYR